tara:strand:- start:450 stop:746 length:297 start_codon:yes stop_codon:yes gene_type:complete
MKYISWIALTISISFLCFALYQNKQITDERFNAIEMQLEQDHYHIEISALLQEIKVIRLQITELEVANAQFSEKSRNLDWQLSTMEDRIVEIQRRLSP